MIWFILFLSGLFISGFSALVGVGGGFILVPFLLLLYPQETPAIVTSISLSVSFFTALSGAIAYARLRRIDYRSGLLFALASVPGAVLGASITEFISRNTFQGLFGFLLLALGVYLQWHPLRHRQLHNPLDAPTLTAQGYRHGVGYSYNLPLGLALSAGEGFISALLGVGGGIIFVPVLIQVLRFPAHIATATSQFILTFTTSAAVGVHAVSGVFTSGYRRTIVLSLAALIGAQLGARLSRRVPAILLIRLLAIAMALLGLRLVAGVL